MEDIANIFKQVTIFFLSYYKDCAGRGLGKQMNMSSISYEIQYKSHLQARNKRSSTSQEHKLKISVFKKGVNRMERRTK